MKALLFVMAFLFVHSGFAADFEIESNPVDCDVFVTGADGKKVALGKTPFKMDVESLKATHGTSGVVNVTVVKPGFESYSIIVPLLSKSAIKISASLEVQKDVQLTQDFDLLASDLFDALRMIRLKDYKSAYGKLDLLEKKFPHFSIVYEMKGATLYLQNEYKMSLNYYRKAFGINPQNREAFRMKNYLEKKFGINQEQAANEGMTNEKKN